MSKVRKYFNITEEYYLQMYKQQNGKCPICDVMLDRHSSDVDHCHSFNRVRGLLCRRCNLGIGLFEENKEWLKKASEYIDKWEDIHSQEYMDER